MQLLIREYVHSVYLGYCTNHHISMLFNLNSLFSLALFAPGTLNGREKS